MKNFKYLIIAAIGLLFAISSCGDDVERKRTLEVGESSLIFKKEGETKTVTVTVDKGTLFTAAWDGDSWGTVIADTNKGVVEITTTANTTPTLRKASVIVTIEGGFRNRVINFTQNGDSPLLAVVPDEISFDFVASEIILDVDSNVEWQGSSSVDWLNVDAFVQTGAIIVKATRNETSEARPASITVTAGSSSKEVSVIQGPSPLILLPYLNTQTASFDDLVAFEEARHATVMQSLGRLKPHIVITNSLLMPTIEVDMMGTRVAWVGCTRISEQYLPGFFRVGKDFGKAHDFMLENKFMYHYSAGSVDYYWAEQPDGATQHYLVTVENNLKYVSYTAMATMPPHPDSPTFDTFPYMPSEITWGSGKDVVKTWEATNGGTLNTEVADRLDYDVVGDPLYKMRQYSYESTGTKLWRTDYVFNDSELPRMFLLTPNGYMLNTKLEAMLASEGFVYFGTTDQGYPLYRHTAKGIEINIYIAQIGEDDSIYYGVIAFLKASASGVAPLKTSTSHYKAVEGIKIIR